MILRLSPYEWDNPHPCKSDPDELETCFNMQNALWFGIGSFLSANSFCAPGESRRARPVAGLAGPGVRVAPPGMIRSAPVGNVVGGLQLQRKRMGRKTAF